MIRVLCLNPVIDRIYYIDSFRAAVKFYEIPPQIYPGGKGVNIARVLSVMGEPCVLYGFVGGSNGRLVEEEMRSLQVDLRLFHTPGETRTTINIINNRDRQETEITEPGAPVGEKEQNDFLTALKRDLEPGDMVICTGIPLRGMSVDIYRQVSVLCGEQGCRCVLDATGVYLKASLPGNYFFSKPNYHEIVELFALDKETCQKELLAWGRRMKDMGIETLMVSMGGDGCMVFRDDAALLARVPPVRVVSTIGSGDATVAGFCLGSSRGMDLADCTRLAMACGCCNAQYSQVGHVEPDQVWELYQKVGIEPLRA